MNKNLIHFESIDWERPRERALQKIYSEGGMRLRLLRFQDDFVEEEWCSSGHIGYILEGEAKIDFDGIVIDYKKGCGLCIQEGVGSKNKAIIEKDNYVVLIVFESTKPRE